MERQQAGVYQCTADNGVGEPVTLDLRLDVLCKYTKKKKNNKKILASNKNLNHIYSRRNKHIS